MRAAACSLALAAAFLALAGCAGAPASTPVGTPAVTVPLVIERNLFEPSELAVTANAPFAIRLENRDTVPHNIAILATPKLATDIFSGPGERTNTFAGLSVGTYTFLCEMHPEMRGMLVSR